MRELADLKDLRVLVVGGRPSGVQILRTVFGVAGISNLWLCRSRARRSIFSVMNASRRSSVDDRSETVGGVPFPLAARRSPACSIR